MGTVTALRRYPVKSMLGEALTSVAVAERGLRGDRVFAVLDDTGTVGSAKHPRKWGSLLRCRSTLKSTDTVVVEVPDGVVLSAGDPDLDARLSRLLGRRVCLSDMPGEQGGVLERAVPDYAGGVPDDLRSTATTDATGAAITSGRVAPGAFFDYGTVHLVTTTALARLRAAYPTGDFDPRRFRPNLVVDTPEGPDFPEDAWIHSRLRIGEALFRVVVPTPRCVMPTLAQEELPPDPGIMRAVAREHRIPVFDLGRLSCVGVYLDVLEPGTVRIGDSVTRIGSS
ncbi:MOSC domain-containing protein [Streptomyces europaeiscabiei]|uniref:MOSC domain-containing protein n=1 Tax=Streptomyces europaeiscabiei TaxID=146819 RepID=UPI0006285CD8|nr:MOSC domain-containing protein [Streptomyces europaeiscabiei]MDX2524509.1 MOSC domain-containing protein [Streptomyces europaeiscabiei]MDX2757105.1 MOSC domain-containing protein [Streptomyces europaeiscabiei]